MSSFSKGGLRGILEGEEIERGAEAPLRHSHSNGVELLISWNTVENEGLNHLCSFWRTPRNILHKSLAALIEVNRRNLGVTKSAAE